MKRKYLLMTLGLTLVAFLFTQCKDDGEMSTKDNGSIAVKMTDAPSDDANIKGTFVTVSEIKVDGNTVEGFSEQTIEVSAYQNGNATLLFEDEIEAKSYNEIELVLNYESDANGDSPGCYVLTTDNEKQSLSSSSSAEGSISLMSDFEVKKDSSTSMVIDFDLRKTVARDTTESGEANYYFIAEADMNSSVRLVDEGKSSNIEGEVQGDFESDSEVYVFAYKKGEYNASSETEGHGEGDVRFFNAVTSAKVNADGSYTLAFVEEGEYEVHLAKYNRNASGRVYWESMIDVFTSVMQEVKVEAESDVKLDIDITAMLN